MYLCIDAGNTRTKVAVFDEQGIVTETRTFEVNSIEPVKDFSSRFLLEHIIISTTGQRDWKISDLEVPGLNMELRHDSILPIRIVYSTPETHGHDRIAAACGAWALHPEKNCLIIDAGTCMTMDVLLKDGIYIGGNIAPGLSMRLQSMHDYTAKLPLVEAEWPLSPFGDSTQHALQNGAALGMLMEIEGLLQRARNAFGEVLIVMTGGNALFLADQVESQIFVEPELVAHGLFQILKFNVEKTY